MASRVLLTGGAGFIGSHTCLVLLEAGYDLLILDNFSNSSPEALKRVAAIANVSLNGPRLQIQHGDIRDCHTLDRLFSDALASDQNIEAVIHFAGLKAVSESVQNPSFTGMSTSPAPAPCWRSWMPMPAAPGIQQQRYGLRLPRNSPDF